MSEYINEYITVSVNGKKEQWPKDEYLDYKAAQYGFDDYDDMLKHGYYLEV